MFKISSNLTDIYPNNIINLTKSTNTRDNIIKEINSRNLVELLITLK